MLWWTLRQLRSGDAADKRAAVAKLGNSRDTRALSALVGALKDPDVSAEAARAIAQIGGPAAKVVLVAALTGDDYRLRGAAADALAGVGDPFVVDLVFSHLPWNAQPHEWRHLEQGLPALLAGLVQRLGPLGLDRLVVQLGHAEARGRALAVEVLELIGGPAARKALVAALGGPSGGVAVWALARLRAPEAVEPLIALIESEQPHAAMVALGEMNDDRASAALVAALNHRSLFVRKCAMSILKEHAHQPVDDDQRIALALARDPGEWPAAEVLGPNATERLRGLLKDESDYVRERAAHLLGDLKDAGAVEELLALLDDPVGLVRASAAQALGAIKDRRAVEGLIGALESLPGSGEMEAVTAALGRIGDGRAVGPIVAVLTDKDRLHETNRALLARPAVSALELVLRNQVTEVASADLRQVAALGTLEARELDSRGWPTQAHLIDTAGLRALADRELRRRETLL